ncbi:AraC family transcriptional regulator [Aquimarina sp. ERC-38]|uniref:AraC family transcriptional regulator n=1 Tax=Aquimarina sp. ERC-38 TaxID=2949996 RepID=UPI00224573D2|nr:AraC family transcriptional regulator [Aquimarina sp. ERC-38]UZO82066.1 AraC family transcriptional regulator [Aquimarina sp. ERC-38]
MQKKSLEYSKIKRIILSVLVFFTIANSTSQSTEKLFLLRNDSLKNKSYDELYRLFYNNFDKDSISYIYAEEYLKKAYHHDDTLKIATGYYMTTLIGKERYFKFNDSLIKYAGLIQSEHWKWLAYYNKGYYYNRKRKYQKALSNHIKAYNLARRVGDYQSINYSIVSLGLLRERIGRYKESLKNFLTSYQYNKRQINLVHPDSISNQLGDSYLNILHLLSNSYRLNKKLDSADIINKDFKKYYKYSWSNKYKDKMRLNAAEVHFDKEEYSDAIDSINIATSGFIESENYKSLAVCYYIRGMSRIKLNQNNAGVEDLITMDSIYNTLGSIYPAVRPGYLFLVKNYEKSNDIKQQLFFIKRLLKFDSIAHENYAYISDELVDKVDKPFLLRQKSRLEGQLNRSNNKTYIWIFLSILISVLLIIEILKKRKIIRQKNKEKEDIRKYYQQKFDQLLSKTKKKLIKKDKTFYRSEDIGISKEVVEEILNSLKNFESKLMYVNPEMTATKLAEKFGTNSNYIGRVIKYKYKKTFRNYINDLRIELALERLRNESEFKNYSVLAIAKEVGFRNAEPFAKAFKSKVGMYPSEFIVTLLEI